MSEYAIYFHDEKDNIKIRLPVNPEELEINTSQTIEKYEILKLGQIAIPSGMDLREFNFEAEFPHDKFHYVENTDKFQNADFYLDQFEKWRKKLIPIRFMAGKDIGGGKVGSDAINTPVLIESLTITEKAGEEQDKYVSFRLLEYKKYSEKYKKKPETESNPHNKGYYVVKHGDTLWGIAKKYYGSGSSYTKIYNANKKIIKNPSLIYPGQKLVIPA